MKKLSLASHNINFSDRKNIIIGQNGSGKTRFLHAIMDHYEKDKGYTNHEIVFADFPHLTYVQDFRNSVDDASATDNFTESSVLLFFMNNAQVSLKQYLLRINKEQKIFVDVLFNHGKSLMYDSAIKLWTKMVKTLNYYFKSTTGYEFDSNKCIMKVKGEEMNHESFQEYISIHASPGERNLFYISIFLSSLKAYRGDNRLAIVLDEPGLHLHMEKIVEFISIIGDVFPNSTLWVAPHSIHLIPLFEFEETVYIKDSAIQKRGGQQGGFYSDIYNSIVGTTHDLSTFLHDINDWEIYRFFEQCLFDTPQPISTDNTDIQTSNILREINKSLEKGNALKILDYGAGQGRFGKIFDSLLLKNSNYKIDYHTFDLDAKKYQAHIKCHKCHYASDEKIPKNTFDFVLLVNTLHEVSPKNWVNIFKNIYTILNDNGYLILCEPSMLSKGEYLNKNHGFIVLEEKALKYLLGENSNIKCFPNDDRKKIVLASTQKKDLERFEKLNPDGVIAESMKIIASTSLEQYRLMIQNSNIEEHNKKIRFENARKLAFFAAQYINANIGLELLDEDNEDNEEKKYHWGTDNISEIPNIPWK